MKRFLTLLLAVLCCVTLLCCMAACKDEQPDNNPDAPVDEQPQATVNIVADGATQYRIVRSDFRVGASDPAISASITLRKAIEAATGVDIQLVTDWEDKDSNDDIYEILIADTNRALYSQVPTDMGRDEFVILFDGKKIQIAGATDLALEKAMDYFIATYLGYDAASGTYSKNTLALPETLNYRGTFEYPTVVYLIDNIKTIPTDSGIENYNDVMRLIASLQGRLNKTAKDNNFYVYLTNDGTDGFWLDYISGEGKMLEGVERININSWTDFWATFGEYIIEAGMVAWDPEVAATANVAATICSVEGYLPVRYNSEKGSLYSWLKDNGVPVKMNLYATFDGELGTKIPETNIDSTGSAKCDAYLWALEKYGDRCNSEMVAYTLDGASCTEGTLIFEKAQGTSPDWNQIYSHDYLIYNECFFFDLTCFDGEVPCDDPEQPLGTDAATLHKILGFFADKNNGKMGKLMGFPPWYMKYTEFHEMGSKPATTLEWDFVEFISAYNFIKEADAAHPAWMTNGSVYTQYESAITYENTDSPLEEVFDAKTRYFTIYMGDYDSSAWLKQHIPNFFRDGNRGEIPLMWGFNPNLGDRVPMIFDYIYENLTANDYIATGDSGAGYVIPAMLPDIDTWVDYNDPYMDKYDMDIVGFIINGTNKMTEREFAAYAEIAPIGSFHNDSSKKLVVWNGETVFMHLMNGINPTDAGCSQAIYNYITTTGNNFSAYRTVCYSPSQVMTAVENFIAFAEEKNDGYTYKCVDPYTLFDLVLQSGQGTKMGD